MNARRGVAYTLLEEFNTHLYPRARALERKLASGQRLSEWEIDHVAMVIERLAEIGPIVADNPEHARIAAQVACMYAAIAQCALRNERGEPPPQPEESPWMLPKH